MVTVATAHTNITDVDLMRRRISGRSVEEPGAAEPARCRRTQAEFAEPCENHPLALSARTMAWTWSYRRAIPDASRRPPTEAVTLDALLDTNVVSELIRKKPNPAVEAWVSGYPLETCSSRRSAKLSCASAPPFCRPEGAGKRWSRISSACCAMLSRTGSAV